MTQLEQNNLENYVIKILIERKTFNSVLYDVIAHFRKLELPNQLITFLLNEELLIDYILNTYLFKQQLENRNISTVNYYAQPKTSNSNFVISNALFPIRILQTKQFDFWRSVEARYNYYLKQLL